MEDKIYYCQNCGGVMVFDAKSQKLKCPNCDTEIDIENDKSKIIEHDFSRREARKIPLSEKKSSTMQCKGCSAVVEIDPDCTATECPYCGSKYVLADKQVQDIMPDGVIPFKIDKGSVKEIFSKWISKRWLAPSKLKNMYERDKIQGIYIPYWTFDADVDCPYTAEGGKERKEKVKKSDGTYEEKTVVDWYDTSGRIKNFFDDVLVSATKNMKNSLLKGIEPRESKKDLVSYSPKYLSGYISECYTVPIEDAHRDAVSYMENKLREMVRSDVRKRYDDVRNVRISPIYSDETYKHILMPVYSTAFSYNNKTYNVVINGQTGAIKGQYPKSPLKIGIIIAAIVAAIVLLIAVTAKGDELNDNKSLSITDNENVVYEIDGSQVETENIIELD